MTNTSITWCFTIPSTTGAVIELNAGDNSITFSNPTRPAPDLDHIVVTPKASGVVPASEPLFSVPPGAFASPQVVTIYDAIPNAVIYFTTDGSMPSTSSAVYVRPLTVSSTETIEALATASGYGASAVAKAVYTIGPPAAAPHFSLAGGVYQAPQTLILTDSTANATIYFTTDGKTPSVSSTVYTSPILIISTQLVKAAAIAPGFSLSPESVKAYTYVPQAAGAPIFSLSAGTFNTPQTVTLTDATPGATVYFTTDDTTPATSSAVYTVPIAVPVTEIIKAIATASGYLASSVASVTYTITPPAATPAFSVPQGTYTAAQSVAISDATPGAIIYYTTDGTIPTTTSQVFSSAIIVSSPEIVRANAVASGYSTSPVASATYTVNIPVPGFSCAATPASLNLTSGQTGKIALSITPTNGFNSSVSFSCSGMPSGVSCNFSPNTVTPTAAVASTTLTIGTPGIVAQRTLPFSSGAALATVLCCIGWRRRRHLPVLALASAAICLWLITACGATSTSPRLTTQQPTTSTITVTAISGSLQQSTNISLTVN